MAKRGVCNWAARTLGACLGGRRNKRNGHDRDGYECQRDPVLCGETRHKHLPANKAVTEGMGIPCL